MLITLNHKDIEFRTGQTSPNYYSKAHIILFEVYSSQLKSTPHSSSQPLTACLCYLHLTTCFFSRTCLYYAHSLELQTRYYCSHSLSHLDPERLQQY